MNLLKWKTKSEHPCSRYVVICAYAYTPFAAVHTPKKLNYNTLYTCVCYLMTEAGHWSEWSACSVTCGTNGVHTRSCTDPPPSEYGRPCEHATVKPCAVEHQYCPGTNNRMTGYACVDCTDMIISLFSYACARFFFTFNCQVNKQVFVCIINPTYHHLRVAEINFVHHFETRACVIAFPFTRCSGWRVGFVDFLHADLRQRQAVAQVRHAAESRGEVLPGTIGSRLQKPALPWYVAQTRSLAILRVAL